MRIISGSLKGRKLEGYNIDGTRPTMDSIKESMFAMINPLSGICLDLFAGAGTLGLEALSNGCNLCYFVDNNRKCIDILNKEIEKFNIKDNAITLNMDYKKALKYFKDNNIKFDLVLLDPPYKMIVINEVIDYLLDNNLLNDNALIVCEMDDNIEYHNKLQVYKERSYGTKKVIIYRV